MVLEHFNHLRDGDVSAIRAKCQKDWMEERKHIWFLREMAFEVKWKEWAGRRKKSHERVHIIGCGEVFGTLVQHGCIWLKYRAAEFWGKELVILWSYCLKVTGKFKNFEEEISVFRNMLWKDKLGENAENYWD